MNQENLDQALFEKLELYCKATGSDITAVQSEAEMYLEEMQSEQQPLMMALGIQLGEYILGRAYEKSIDVNAAELKSLSELMRSNSIAFVMTHKTYVDMFVLAVVLARHGLSIPYVFAGINMAFFGLSQLGNNAGAIFIRRDIKDNELYKIALRHYITTLVNNHEHFMWAIEGTRSRTGKLVWPKMGILKYILDAEAEIKHPVKYVPVSIVYDLIPDVHDMTSEGRGKTKTQENLMWFLDYLRKMGDDYGKISIRFGKPVSLQEDLESEQAQERIKSKAVGHAISGLAFELMHGINKITPVTTISLIFTSLLSKFALTLRSTEQITLELMKFINHRSADALVDRGKLLSQSITASMNLLSRSGMIKQIGEGLEAKYTIVPEHYLDASYYSNMAAHYLYHRGFIELALLHIAGQDPENRSLAFWEEIMSLRESFKFEFFYSKKTVFVEEIEKELEIMDPNWEQNLIRPEFDILRLLKQQSLFVSNVILSTYVEAYSVVAQSLKTLDASRVYNEKQLLRVCLFMGEEMHWKGQINRVDSVSKPFLLNGIRYAQNKKLISNKDADNSKQLDQWLSKLEDYKERLRSLQLLNVSNVVALRPLGTENVQLVPGSKTANFVDLIKGAETGKHVGAFFDLDRTLIAGFSAQPFFQKRLLSGKMSTNEIVAQFAGALVYGLGNKNYAGLAAIGAKGVKGIPEKVFLEVGEEVYLNNLSKAIYPESRALVEAHLAKGHTVAIISAATPYQVTPVARDLGIDYIMCTKMEVSKGLFTGRLEGYPCWGDGKAKAAMALTDQYGLDLEKSYFYTDSAEDLPLLEIVGHPRPVNPDMNLSVIAYENDWPIFRFDNESRNKLSNAVRTLLAFGSLVPAALTGLAQGTSNMSWREGINSMTSVVGDLGTFLAGIRTVIKGEENMWIKRPAVFIFNHQSNVDLLIMAKLLRKDAVGIAKKELQYTPIGPLLQAAGVIFIDRKNKEKAIEALKPAIEALKTGTSVGIAPEGTRSKDYTLGQFKKGAFHLAMEARVPIVPVIIKNAHDAMPRGSNFVQPSVVEIKILKPVSTVRWTKESLNKHISKIRNQFLEELGQKPIKKAKRS